MGAGLAAAFPAFAAALDEACAALDEACAALDPLLRHPTRDAVLHGPADALDQTGTAQPALFTYQVALYRLLESLGVRPDVLRATPPARSPPPTPPAS